MKLRMRVKGSSKGTKLVGGSSSSNPKSMKHRSAARAQRIANIYPMIAVDERMDGGEGGNGQKQQLEKAIVLPLDEMSLNGKKDGQQNTHQTEKQKQKLPKRETEESADLLNQLTSADISLENKQKLLKREHQLWQILPSHLAASPHDFQKTMPILAPILGAALNERPDLRLTALASIRAALQMDKSMNIMGQFAKNFLPILFSIYTNDGIDQEEIDRKIDPKAVHLSTLETLRLYMRHIPKDLLKQYISVALKKLAGPNVPKGQISDKNLSLADILISMCISADGQDLQSIFNCLEHWFDSNDGRMKKKAFRLMAQVYQRIGADELKEFFDWNRPILHKLIGQGIEKLNKSSFQWRIAIYRNVLNSFKNFDECFQFCSKIFNEIIEFLDPLNSSPTRQQSANCLLEMSEKLHQLWSKESEDSTNPLDWMFAELFKVIPSKIDENSDQYQCALIALNFLAQKQLKNVNAALISQLIGHSTGILQQISNPKCRVLAIRLVRTICRKMPAFMFEQFKEIIMKAIFNQSTKNPTVRIRKSNALLLNLLLDRLGREELLKFIETGENCNEKQIWAKMLKNLEKMRRRRERRKEGGSQQIEGRSNVGGGTPSMVSGTTTTALSSLISLGAKTANADSIFDILGEESSDEEEEKTGGMNRKKRRMKGNKLSVLIEEKVDEEDDEDDPLDLMDRRALESKVSLVKNLDRKEEIKKRKMDGEFRMNKEGKLLIENLDKIDEKNGGKKPKKRRRRRIEDDEEEEEEKDAEEEEE